MSSIVDRNTGYQDFIGEQPAADKVPKRTRVHIFKRMGPDYVDFLQERLPWEACDKIKKEAAAFGVEVGRLPDDPKKPFLVTDLDVKLNGVMGNSCVLVKPGNPDKPFRIIIAHSDVPCLKVRAQPIHVELDAERTLGCPSVSLSAEEFGGIRPDDWYGKEVDIVGKVFMAGKERDILLSGRIKQKSVHVDSRDAIKTREGLKVDTGFRTLDLLYEQLGIKDHMDFGRANLYVVPYFKRGDNGRLVGHELGAFGQDDRVCMWASMTAGLESLAKTDNTLIVAALENEEIGSSGISASYRGFFEFALKEAVRRVYGDKAGEIDLPLDLNRKLLGGWPAISADVDVGLGYEEMQDHWDIDFKSAAKMGWGFVLSAQAPSWYSRSLSAKHIDNLMELFKKALPLNKQEQRFQVTGSPHSVDSESTSGTFADQFDRFFPSVDMGVPVVGLHHPGVEVVNLFDLFWLKEGYKAYLRA
ncbi:hypothetical protein FJZ17_03570 [Candidatus Pacearchaeota archaeon]|nr:hypothetical protein [Candidatus Pacearchaeota archaeon]